jgi:hypothetical protein
MRKYILLLQITFQSCKTSLANFWIFHCQDLKQLRDQHVTIVCSLQSPSDEASTPKCRSNELQQELGFSISHRQKEKNKLILVCLYLVILPKSQSPEPLLPQMADVDEPDEPNISDQCDIPTIPNEDDSKGSEGSDGSSVEIIDGGSDAEICEETELQRFSRILCEAQRKAQAQEKAKGNTRKTYQGLSRTTAYRRKRVRNDLAAQGFLSVPLYMA